jgi:hypothetical protein
MLEPQENDSAAEGDLKSDSDPTNGTKKERSGTPYPYFGLSKAIEIVEAVRKAGGNEASSADVRQALGVTKTTDRMWAYGIPAAVQFGLVERVGRGEEGRIKLTELAIRLALPGSELEQKAAKIAAFKQPEIYTKLLAKFSGHPVPTKDGLKNIMVREFKILESMAPIAAEAFLDSLNAAELVTAGNTIAFSGESGPVQEKPNAISTTATHAAVTEKTITVPADFIVYKCKISQGRVIEIPLPSGFTQADVKRLHAFLLTQVDDDATE